MPTPAGRARAAASPAVALQKDRSKETAQMRRSAAQLTPSSVALTRRWSERVLRQAPAAERRQKAALLTAYRGA